MAALKSWPPHHSTSGRADHKSWSAVTDATCLNSTHSPRPLSSPRPRLPFSARAPLPASPPPCLRPQVWAWRWSLSSACTWTAIELRATWWLASLRSVVPIPPSPLGTIEGSRRCRGLRAGGWNPQYPGRGLQPVTLTPWWGRRALLSLARATVFGNFAGRRS